MSEKTDVVERTRKTEIVAHCGKNRLQAAFPDELIEKRIKIFPPNGEEPLDMLYSSWAKKDELLVRLVEACGEEGWGYEKYDRKKVYDSYVKIGHTAYSIRKLTERTTAVVVSTNKPESEHYEVVDEIVKELAKKDIAVLRGDCEITITTRC